MKESVNPLKNDRSIPLKKETYSIAESIYWIPPSRFSLHVIYIIVGGRVTIIIHANQLIERFKGKLKVKLNLDSLFKSPLSESGLKMV